MADIKNYHSTDHGLYSSIVLPRPYNFTEGRLVTREMANMLSLQMIKRDLVADQFSLTLHYDAQNLRHANYHGTITKDFYGRDVPHPSHGTFTLSIPSAVPSELLPHFLDLFDQHCHRQLLLRKVTVTANRLISQQQASEQTYTEQLDLFTDPQRVVNASRAQQAARKKDYQVQKLVLKLQQDFGKNAIIRAADLKSGAVAKKRNREIGGHQA